MTRVDKQKEFRKTLSKYCRMHKYEIECTYQAEYMKRPTDFKLFLRKYLNKQAVVPSTLAVAQFIAEYGLYNTFSPRSITKNLPTAEEAIKRLNEQGRVSNKGMITVNPSISLEPGRKHGMKDQIINFFRRFL